MVQFHHLRLEKEERERNTRAYIRKLRSGRNYMAKRNYNRCCKLIVLINEAFCNDEEESAEPLLDELGELRKTLDELESEVIGRLCASLTIVRSIEIDEASDVLD